MTRKNWLLSLIFLSLNEHFQRVHSAPCDLLTSSIFSTLAPSATAPYTYNGLCTAITNWNTANPSNQIFTSGTEEQQKHELAAFLGNTLHESGDFVYAREQYMCPDGTAVDQSGTLYCKPATGVPTSAYCQDWNTPSTNPDGCLCSSQSGTTINGDSAYVEANKLFFGRGAIQLSWNYNYIDASVALTVSASTFCDNPELVATNEVYAWGTAIWFWMLASHASAVGGDFGGTLSSINGGLECTADPNYAPTHTRLNKYCKAVKAFLLPEILSLTGCTGLQDKYNTCIGSTCSECDFTGAPTTSPTKSPTVSPTTSPTKSPIGPTTSPTKNPTSSPTTSPTKSPIGPTTSPTKNPTTSPTTSPTKNPTASPTTSPTANPTTSPTKNPTASPTPSPTKSPVPPPGSPTRSPTPAPTTSPTSAPTAPPTTSPTPAPTPTNPAPTGGTCGTCPSSGWGIVSSADCTGFYHCDNGSIVQPEIKCSTGLLFDESIYGCDYPDRVTCACTASPPTPTTPSPTPPSPTPPTPTPPTSGPATCGTCSSTWGLVATEDCTGFYYCYNGAATAPAQYCGDGLLFSSSINGCDYDYRVTCSCTTTPTTPTAPTPTPPTPTPPTPTPPTPTVATCGSCPTGSWGMVANSDCSGYYYCYNGVAEAPETKCSAGTLYDPSIMGCDYEDRVTCPCATATPPSPTPPTPAPPAIETCGPCSSSWGLAASSDCSGYYYCSDGAPYGSEVSCGSGLLFNSAFNGCDHEDQVTCACGSPAPPPSPATTAAPPSPAVSTCGVCPTSGWSMISASGCSGFYHCIDGQPSYYTSCSEGTLYDAAMQGCNWEDQVTCGC